MKVRGGPLRSGGGGPLRGGGGVIAPIGEKLLFEIKKIQLQGGG